MKKALILLFTMSLCLQISAQVSYDELFSYQLNQTRELKVKLPKNYDENALLKHPVIIVFDGDYLFEPVVGQVEFQTYFDDMPGSIVVGIMQGNERFYDSYVDEATGLPVESGANFYEFIGKELLPYIDSKYNTSKFRVAVGHNKMGNFINAFALKELPLFQAYVNLSPDFVGNMQKNIINRLQWMENDFFYYMATSDNDIPQIRDMVLEAHLSLKNLDNKKVTYYFDDFNNDTHYTLVSSAISRAFDKIFDLYKPLREKEIIEKVIPYEGTLDVYLAERYERLDELFGIEKPIPEEEFEKIAKIAEEREDIETFRGLGKLAKKQNPESLLGTYYLAQYAEKSGKNKKAKKLYESALTLNDVSHVNREFIFSKIDELTIVDTDDENEEDDEEN
ncbi:alpha/beta hydrolase-fold protein [Ichthyenterobacterium sp. W332]|uniref:Alpha/beta hydrolase-fold protein n=1 Tax=Microcosmobacter mediterraneus TaxID=3075607 RepID=A0ABU2YI62_9FLAO|nr:alpha/beta hydrolase-fold protein [Ichthyenterobacterium sp. W332]MDT0557859.1 alpha/beta hydrolase-fold protein [Ichthyenterobacterium sp. W332]